MYFQVLLDLLEAPFEGVLHLFKKTLFVKIVPQNTDFMHSLCGCGMVEQKVCKRNPKFRKLRISGEILTTIGILPVAGQGGRARRNREAGPHPGITEQQRLGWVITGR